MQAVESATSEIVVASYMFDHAALAHALVCRLSRQAALSVSVLVDLAAFNERTSRHQRPRLVALRNAGAKIYLCRGKRPPLGIFHMKSISFDRRCVFTGGANFTEKSLDNEELTMRIVGPPVADILIRVELARRQGRLCCSWGRLVGKWNSGRRWYKRAGWLDCLRRVG